MNKKIAILSGDGIGPEIMAEAVKVLKEIEATFGHRFTFEYASIGGAAWDLYGIHFPEQTVEICKSADAILFGSVGGPVGSQEKKWVNCEKNSILALRNLMGLTCNLRPIESIDGKVDILCVRELSEDIYFGSHQIFNEGKERIAKDVMFYRESTIRNISHKAFQLAMSRNKKVSSVDKANVLDCSKLWREVVNEVSKEYPECKVEHILVDNCAMQIAKDPHSFDVLLMPNLFGDILSDLASVWSDSLGMVPSASFSKQGMGLYEPAGGAASDIAGKEIANPIGQILSVALMLKHSFHMEKESNSIFQAVKQAMLSGYKTKDLASLEDYYSTSQMGNIICKFIKLKGN